MEIERKSTQSPIFQALIKGSSCVPPIISRYITMMTYFVYRNKITISLIFLHPAWTATFKQNMVSLAPFSEQAKAFLHLGQYTNAWGTVLLPRASALCTTLPVLRSNYLARNTCSFSSNNFSLLNSATATNLEQMISPFIVCYDAGVRNKQCKTPLG